MTETDNSILERFNIDLNRRLEALDSVGAEACGTGGEDGEGPQVYALVQKRLVPSQVKLIDELHADPCEHLLIPLATGIVEVPTASGSSERFVTIVEAPTGPPLVGDWQVDGLSIDSFVKKTLVGGAFAALDHLHELGYAHRAIRPDNIFLSTDPEIGIVLGDCFSAPPGAGQHDIYEPLERSTAHPAGRGAGDSAADMFALGVTVLELYTGKTPGEGRSRQELYHARIAQGSYWAYAGGRDLPGAIASLVRNLLNDDPAERWTLMDLKLWLGGQEPKKLSGFSNWSTSRPVQFMGQSFSDRRLLAEAFNANVGEAARYLSSRDYPSWIQQVVASENFSDRLERLLQPVPPNSQDTSSDEDDALVAKYVAFMDPTGPIRYRGVAIAFDGIGPALADAFARGDSGSIDTISRLFSSKLLIQLAEISEEHNPFAADVMQGLGPAVRVMQSKAAGMGIERVLYDLNPGLPCLQGDSGLWTSSVGAALQALEQAQSGASQGGTLFDKHFMAFCSSRERGLEALFAGLGRTAGDPTRAALATADVIAHLQGKNDVGPLPALCERLADRLKPVIGSLQNRRLRESAGAQLAELAKAGDAAHISSRLNLNKLQALDRKEYADARARFAQLKRDRARLEQGINGSDPAAQHVGYQAAAAFSILMLGLSTALFMWGA